MGEPATAEQTGEELMAFIAGQLAAQAQARGEPVDEDRLTEACTLIAAAQLVRAGASLDAVERQFRDRDHTFRVAYEPDEETGEPCLVVEVQWDDESEEASHG